VGSHRAAGEADFHKVNEESPGNAGVCWRENEERTAMFDTIFTISTLIFFGLSVLYVKFCDGLR
jgi:hypothetical protein